RYTTPTPIQEQAIPPLRAGRDVLGRAQTGTGQTAGFGIPLIEAIGARVRAVQAIVLVPRRELCLQAGQEVACLGRSGDVRALAHRQMRNPVTIAITPERPTVDLIAQRFEPVPDGDKLAALTAHLDSPHCVLALVFRRTTHKADRLAHDLTRRGYRVAVLHGRRTQGQRERV